MVNATNTTQVIVPNMEIYTFGSSITEDYTVQSEDVFKRNPGIGGFVYDNQTDKNPQPNVEVNIYDSKNKWLATVYTDQDGWYMRQYKYTGKAATFYVKSSGQTKSVTLKSNGFPKVDFYRQ